MTRSPRWRGALTSAAAAAALIAAPLMGAQTAHADAAPYPPPPPTLTLTATTVQAGGRLGFRGTGFAPRQRVEADLRSFVVVLGIFRANANGVVTGTVTIPRSTRPGYHTFELIGRNPYRRAAARIKVLRSQHRAVLADPVNTSYDDKQPKGASLASTGSGTALALGGAAAVLIAAGGATMFAVRRRRSS
ncbi:hypothetical protein [Streptomyces canus]|uniref:Gram-positive cocci surface proteins LPxTG domain-containing protein n=1 Tax=Streptomyces canus TaxID=58343 RepID=A0AAW8FFN6_9ACTN|nr:hypothetical protein [Streptomyces canus]MDQ0762570.1 hypothetical protein [Streptomyces canus]MDQ0908961.1 hypothetical protein [Streptomyces canus]MDQ1068988.1 hypothetical protein [Streptomyces canus]